MGGLNNLIMDFLEQGRTLAGVTLRLMNPIR